MSTLGPISHLAILWGILLQSLRTSTVKIEYPLSLNLTELDRLKDESTSPILLHLYNSSACTGDCEEDLQVIKSIAGELLQADDTLRLVSAKTAPDVLATTVVGPVKSSAVFAYVKGYPLRLDTHGLPEDQQRNLGSDLKSFFSKQMPEIKTVEEWKSLEKFLPLIYIYYGLPSDEAYAEVEVACRLSNIIIYWSSSVKVAKVVGMDYPEYLYTYIPELKKAYRLRRVPTVQRVSKFLDTSARPLPAPFDAEIATQSIKDKLPVLFLKGGDSEVQAILDMVDENEELLRNYFHVYLLQDDQDPASQLIVQQCTRIDRPKPNSTICIIRERGGLINRYIHTANLTADSFRTFLEKYISHKLMSYYRNEALGSATSAGSDKVELLNTKNTDKFFSGGTDDDNKPRILYVHTDTKPECDEFSKLFDKASLNPAFSQLRFGRINQDKNELLLPETAEPPVVLAYQVALDENPTSFTVSPNSTLETLTQFLTGVHSDYSNLLRELQAENKIRKGGASASAEDSGRGDSPETATDELDL